MSKLNKIGEFTLLSVACLTIMVGCVIVPDLNRISVNLGVPHAAGWLVTTPSLGVVVFSPVAGRLIERVGARTALTGGLFFYGLLGAGGVFFHGPIMVLADRLLLGGATSVVMSAGTTLISDFYSGRARLKMIALQGMSIELGGVVFLFIGGLMALAGWYWPFSLYLVAWVLMIMLLLSVPRHNLKHRETIIPGEDHTQKGIPQPLRLVYFVAVFSMVFFFTGIITLPRYLHSIDFSASETGYFLSFVSFVAMVTAVLLPSIMDKLKEVSILYIAFGCYSIAHFIFAISTTVPPIMAGGVLMGFGFGLSVPLVNHLTVERSHEKYRGRNLAMLSMAIFSGQFLSSFTDLISGNPSIIFLISAATCIAVMAVIYRAIHPHSRNIT
ncbi:MFS transporter [Klebsiella pneumoniae]|uniref:MFS transporter n=1 Tax=Klebsiella pneumoniae TaxID=573 RepID=UPI00203E71BB|nr:MFS transporter [Klebsiella pneumoniae]USB65771.1 MFS transporter [Klebsiella pneumoniae]HCB1396542.1 MFS transporter [Klebsiella pneumoniae]